MIKPEGGALQPELDSSVSPSRPAPPPLPNAGQVPLPVRYLDEESSSMTPPVMPAIPAGSLSAPTPLPPSPNHAPRRPLQVLPWCLAALFFCATVALTLVLALRDAPARRVDETPTQKYSQALRAFGSPASGPADAFAPAGDIDRSAVQRDLSRVASPDTAPNPDRIVACFDTDRMIEDLYDQGLLKHVPRHRLSETAAAFRVGMRRAIGKGSEWDINRIEVRRVVPLPGRRNALAFVRIWLKDGTNGKARWWITCKDGQWRIYDTEDLQAGLRLSNVLVLTINSANAGGGRAAWFNAIPAYRDARAALGARDLPAAERELAKLRNVTLPAPLEAQRLLMEGIARTHHEEYDAAARFYDQAEALAPDLPMLLFLRASLNNRQGNHEKALKFAQQFLDLLGDDAVAYNETGFACERQGRLPEAAEAYAKGLADDPRDYSNLAGLARVTPREKIAELSAALARCPDPKAAFIAVAPELPDVDSLSRWIEAYRDRGARDPELAYYDALVLTENDRPVDAMRAIEPWLDRLDGNDRRQRFNDAYCNAAIAARQFDRAYERAINHTMTFLHIAQQCVDDGDAAALQKVIELHRRRVPDDLRLRQFTGELHLLRKEYAQAVAEFAVCVKRMTIAQGLLSVRQRLYFAQYKAGDALTVYRESSEKSGSFETLLAFCQAENDAAGYSAVLEAHRANLTEPGDLPWYQSGLRFLDKDYPGTAKLLIENASRILERDSTRRYMLRDRLIRSLIRDGQFREARKQLQALSDGQPASFFELLIALGANDVPAAEAAARKLRTTMPYYYDDPDVGPALARPAFAELRREFPPAPKQHSRR